MKYHIYICIVMFCSLFCSCKNKEEVVSLSEHLARVDSLNKATGKDIRVRKGIFKRERMTRSRYEKDFALLKAFAQVDSFVPDKPAKDLTGEPILFGGKTLKYQLSREEELYVQFWYTCRSQVDSTLFRMDDSYVEVWNDNEYRNIKVPVVVENPHFVMLSNRWPARFVFSAIVKYKKKRYSLFYDEKKQIVYCEEIPRNR